MAEQAKGVFMSNFWTLQKSSITRKSLKRSQEIGPQIATHKTKRALPGNLGDTMRKYTTAFMFIAISSAMTGSLTGCLGQPYASNGSSNNWAGQAGCQNGNCGGSGGSNGQTFVPNYAYDFTVTGPAGPEPTYSRSVNTDGKLLVKINAGPAANVTNPAFPNFSAAYGCATFNVSVTGQSVRTVLLEASGGNSYYCRYAAWQNNREVLQEQVIDFSDRVTYGNPGPYTVSVSAPQYDFYCILGWAGFYVGAYNSVCPVKNAYTNGTSSHRITGHLEIEVEGGSPL